jgi:hypothetical protein
LLLKSPAARMSADSKSWQRSPPGRLELTMPWSRKLVTQITLKDGRTIATLSQARELMLSLPIAHRGGDMWRYTARLLNVAAADKSYVPHIEAEAQFTRSLKIEGLL